MLPVNPIIAALSTYWTGGRGRRSSRNALARDEVAAAERAGHDAVDDLSIETNSGPFPDRA